MTPSTANMTTLFNMPPRGPCSVPGGAPIANSSNRVIGLRFLRVMGEKLSPKILECSRDNRRARPSQKAQVHVQVMPRHEPQPQNLVCPEQVPDVRPAEVPASVALAALFQRPEILPVGCILDRVRAARRKDFPVAPSPRRQHAIKHIDPPRDHLQHLW